VRSPHHSVIAAALAAFALSCSRPEPRAGDSCRTIEDCVTLEALACLQGECVRVGCSRSVECPAGAACVSGRCRAAECDSDDDCPGTTCFEGDCRSDLCAFKAECDEGEVCIGTPPKCAAPPSRCTVDRECPTDRFCRLPEGTCDRKCTSDASCAAGSYCDGDFCRLACDSSADCADQSYCVDGRCLESDCDERDCPDARPFTNPVSCTCTECLADRDCVGERNERCTASGTCSYCPISATSDAQCVNQGLVPVGGCCAECAADRDCLPGTHCNRGRCVLDDPRDCADDEDCPRGARCDLGWCVLPGSMTPCAIQDDCVQDEACYSDGRCRAQSTVCADCPSPSRCVAEPGDDVGTCVGCELACDDAACGEGDVCFVDAGAVDGYCVAVETAPECD